MSVPQKEYDFLNQFYQNLTQKGEEGNLVHATELEWSRIELGKQAEKLTELQTINTNLNQEIKDLKLDKANLSQKNKDLTADLTAEQQAQAQTAATLKATQEKATQETQEAQQSMADLEAAKKELETKHNSLIEEYGSLSEA